MNPRYFIFYNFNCENYCIQVDSEAFFKFILFISKSRKIIKEYYTNYLPLEERNVTLYEIENFAGDMQPIGYVEVTK